MELKDAVSFFESYNLFLLIVGVAILAASILPRVLSQFPLSMPIIILTAGFLIFSLPFSFSRPDPQVHSVFIEHISELAVIIAVMAAGLKINRKPSFRNWNITWRLLGITMTLTMVFAALIGWWFAAFVPATAVLLGAVIAPTDPVLASEIEEEGPGEGAPEGSKQKAELKFGLTSEAGLNDGLAFPFTNMAIAMALFGSHPSNWIESWFLVNVLYELAVGIAVGVGMGYLLARFILNLPAKTEFAKIIVGIGSLAATLIIYGCTEILGGYGFIAVFCGAITIRQFEPDHIHQVALHALIEKSQLILTALLLLALGAAISGGILRFLDSTLIIIAVVLVLVIRPLCGMIGLAGFKKMEWKSRSAVAFLGIRGFGSVYYLAYAVNHSDFEGSDRLWSLVILVIVLSVFIHGISASSILKKITN
ncbi:cation:proton antiporter [Flavobacterium tegetincola]|uniref:cation:proton antiporter n=1 Tax=Flavobacterium tegetincola TaxID=150172 RepID=UPI00042036DE|nr:cation:proton antiporter [Flavobacterium tegetincola]